MSRQSQLAVSPAFLKAGTVLLVLVAAGGFSAGRYGAVPWDMGNRGAFENAIAGSGIIQWPSVRGAAWGDYDNDGDFDLFLAGGRTGSKLYRNNGDSTFREVTKEAGIQERGTASAAAFGDYDNDGCLDLYIANEAVFEVGTADQLMRNNCEGTFTDVSESAGIDKVAYNTDGVAWADYNRDGFLDLYAVSHGGFGETTIVHEPNVLWRNNGEATFIDVAGEAGVVGNPACPGIELPPDNQLGRIPVGGPFKWSYQPVWFDYDKDMWPDLFVATDNNVSPLYRNNGDGTFTDVTEKAGLCRMGTGMGIALGDYDNDGDLDFYVTNDGPNYLWRNNGDGTFTEAARQAGVRDEDSIGWGTEFFDYDNDGDLDLYVANGSVGEREVILMLDKLYRNEGEGKFVQVAAHEGIEGNYPKEGSALADYDENGFVDILTVPAPSADHKPYKLYRNRGNGNNWLKVQLIGEESNRDGIGAKLFVTTAQGTQIREAQSGSSYLSQSASWQHIGLGRSSLVERLEVLWPSGKRQTFSDLQANQTVTVREE